MRRVRETVVVMAGSVVLVFIGGASDVTAAGGGPRDDDEQPISGNALRRAGAAALAATGGGRVSDTEVGDEDGYYAVEVTFDDGAQIDVRLDEYFAVVHSDPAVEEPESGRR